MKLIIRLIAALLVACLTGDSLQSATPPISSSPAVFGAGSIMTNFTSQALAPHSALPAEPPTDLAIRTTSQTTRAARDAGTAPPAVPDLTALGVPGRLDKHLSQEMESAAVFLTEQEIGTHLGPKALGASRSDGRRYYIRYLNATDRTTWDRWKTQWKQDANWRTRNPHLGEYKPSDYLETDIPSLGLFSRAAGEEQLEGALRYSPIGDSIIELNTIELFYRNMGRNAELTHVADLLLDALIKIMVSNPTLQNRTISMGAVMKGSRDQASRRDFVVSGRRLPTFGPGSGRPLDRPERLERTGYPFLQSGTAHGPKGDFGRLPSTQPGARLNPRVRTLYDALGENLASPLELSRLRDALHDLLGRWGTDPLLKVLGLDSYQLRRIFDLKCSHPQPQIRILLEAVAKLKSILSPKELEQRASDEIRARLYAVLGYKPADPTTRIIRQIFDKRIGEHFAQQLLRRSGIILSGTRIIVGGLLDQIEKRGPEEVLRTLEARQRSKMQRTRKAA